MKICAPVVVVLALAATLSSCVAEPEVERVWPTVFDTPGIVYSVEPVSDFDDNGWVQAAQASALGVDLAVSLGDFSIEQFTATRERERAESQYLWWRSEYTSTDDGLAPPHYKGPRVLLPLSVEMTGENTATVRFCDATTESEIYSPDDIADGREFEVRLVQVDSRILEVLTVPSAIRCDATGAGVGVYDPQFPPLEPMEAADAPPPYEDLWYTPKLPN
ncbi:hypothetical protein ESZ53_06590 [Salinibacterium sp. UTAS2018]|uniref:hypothetical protein n=1 Tax=Salinibacterium sp. UTAS2018 TaxID=2508880 RepID=UPI001009465E|nr:hypothetical protein [Salinibacterium sp. UTAS2018]QAV70133.1 hypothetical protein ESZ53_06590 [Salinibacterium sp. UTAS2018]